MDTGSRMPIDTTNNWHRSQVASRSVWDGTLTGSGQPVDFTTFDFFRIEDGAVEEHWESVDWISAYKSFGLLNEEVNDV
jgi:hypothetical protein